MESTKDKFIVEFLGIPGSGKTTLVNACVKLLKEQGLSVYYVKPPLGVRWRKITNSRNFFFRTYLVIKFFYVTFFSILFFPRKTVYLVNKLFLNLFNYEKPWYKFFEAIQGIPGAIFTYKKCKKYKGIIIIDEGAFSTFRAFAAHGQNEKESYKKLFNQLSSLPLFPSLIFAINVDKKTAIERKKMIKKPFLYENLLVSYDAEKLIKKAIQDMNKQKLTEIIFYDIDNNSKNYQDVAIEITKVITSLWKK